MLYRQTIPIGIKPEHDHETSLGRFGEWLNCYSQCPRHKWGMKDWERVKRQLAAVVDNEALIKEAYTYIQSIGGEFIETRYYTKRSKFFEGTPWFLYMNKYRGVSMLIPRVTIIDDKTQPEWPTIGYRAGYYISGPMSNAYQKYYNPKCIVHHSPMYYPIRWSAEKRDYVHLSELECYRCNHDTA